MNILVVDDETDVQPLFEQRFRHEVRRGALTLSFVNSGESALHFLAQDPAKATLILSDINMPGMSGLDLLRQIRRGPTLPPPIVMIMTAYGDQQSHEQALQCGANDFLTKPLDFGQLKEKLSQLQPV